MQSTVLYQQSGNGSAALIQAGFNDSTLGAAGGIGFELLHIRNQLHHLKQLVDSLVGFGGNRNADHISAPFLRHQAVLGELLLHALHIGGFLINFIDGDNDGNLGGLGMVDGLNRLGHDAVVRRDHQNGDIRNLGASGTHGGKCLMARSIQERDGTILHLDTVRADMLGDAAGLRGGHIGVADGVQQRGFTMVNVAHHHHDRAAALQILCGVVGIVNQAILDGDDHFPLHFGANFHGHQGRGIIVDNIGNGSHHAVEHQLLDNLGGLNLQAQGKLSHRNLVGDGDLQLLTALALQLQLAHLGLFLLLAGLEGLILTGGFLVELLLFHPIVLACQIGGGDGLIALIVLIQIHRSGLDVNMAALHNLHTVFFYDSGLAVDHRTGRRCRSFRRGRTGGTGSILIPIPKSRAIAARAVVIEGAVIATARAVVTEGTVVIAARAVVIESPVVIAARAVVTEGAVIATARAVVTEGTVIAAARAVVIESPVVMMSIWRRSITSTPFSFTIVGWRLTTGRGGAAGVFGAAGRAGREVF